MITYLEKGWYAGQTKRLNKEVIDGAIDAASMLYKAGVSIEMVSKLALKIRMLATLTKAPHFPPAPTSTPQPTPAELPSSGLSTHEHQVLLEQLRVYTDPEPFLQAFIVDCFEHVQTLGDLNAFYLHIVHITQMMQLLRVANLPGTETHKANLEALDRAALPPSSSQSKPTPKTSQMPPKKKNASKAKTPATKPHK